MSLSERMYLYVDEDNKPSHVLPFLYLAARLRVRAVVNVDPIAYAPDQVRDWWEYQPHTEKDVGDFRYVRLCPMSPWDNVLSPYVLRLIPQQFSLKPCCGTPWFPTFKRVVRVKEFVTFGCSTNEYREKVPGLRLSRPSFTESRIAGATTRVQVHGGLLTLCQCTLARAPVVVKPLGNDQFQNKIFWDRLRNPKPKDFIMTTANLAAIRKLLKPFIWRNHED